MSVHYFCVLFCSNIIQHGRGDQGLFGFLPEDIWQQASCFSGATPKKSLGCFWAARSLNTRSCIFSLCTCYDEWNFHDLSRNQSQVPECYKGENLCPQARVAKECQNGAIFSNNVGIDEKIPFECLLGLPLLRGLEVSSISETIDVTISMNPGLDPAPSAVEKGYNR